MKKYEHSVASPQYLLAFARSKDIADFHLREFVKSISRSAMKLVIG
jgi:hypothetical protein